MNLGFIIDHLPPGGTEKQLIELINRLDPNKFRIDLFFLRKIENCLDDQVLCQKYFLNINNIQDIFLTSHFFKFVQLLRKKRIDIIQTYFPDSTFLGVLAAKIASVPVILTARRDMGAWHRKMDRAKYWFSNFFTHRWVVNSKAIKDYLVNEENVSCERVDIIYNGIDSRLFTNNKGSNVKNANNGLIVGIVSNFNRYVKRLDVFIKAMILLAGKYEHVNFLIIGKVENKHWNIQIPEELMDRFTFTGEVIDTREHLRNIDIGILCSDSEGFSNVILEYLASSIPCVCSKTGGNTEIIMDNVNGFLFPPGDHRALSEKTSILIENSDLRSEFVKNALRKIMEKYAWENIIKEYENYYMRLIKAG